MNNHARMLGFAGLIPFIALPLMVMSQALAVFEAVLYFCQYSAVILSFLGGVHWYDAIHRTQANSQLTLAMLPSIIAWLALVLLPYDFALWTLAAAYLATLVYDHHALSPPKGYLPMRIKLTTLVVACHAAMLWVYHTHTNGI